MFSRWIYKNVPPQLKEGSIVSKENEGGIIADQIFKRIAALNSDHGPVLGRLVRCLDFLVLYILWSTSIDYLLYNTQCICKMYRYKTS